MIDTKIAENGKSTMTSIKEIDIIDDINDIDDTHRFQSLKFLRHSIKLSPGVSKEQLRSLMKINRNDWVEQSGYDKLLRSLSEGYIHQLELLDGKKDVIVLDFDFFDKSANSPILNALPIDEILSLPTAKMAIFYQKSLSYREDAQNFHLYYLMDRSISANESCLITKQLVLNIRKEIAGYLKVSDNNETFGLDDCVSNNSKQLIFSSLYPPESISEVVVPSDIVIADARISGIKITKSVDVDSGVQKQKKVSQLAPLVEPKTPTTVTDAILDYFYEQIFLVKCKEDIKVLYNLHSNNGWNSRQAEGDEIERLECSVNPFSASNNSGSSFMVIYESGKLPRFWDKSGSFENSLSTGYSTNHGTYLDYFYHCMKKLGKYKGNEKGVDGSFIKGFFRTLLGDICEYFSIDHFNFDSLNKQFSDVCNELMDHFLNKIFYLGKNTYYFFEDKKWRIVGDPNVCFSFTIGRYLKENYQNVPVYDGKKRIAYDDDEYLDIMRKISRTMEYQINPSEMPLENFEYIPYTNGLYDIKNKKLIENEGQAHNRSIVPWKYQSKMINPEIIIMLGNYLNELFVCTVAGELLYAWLMLNCQRKAFDTTFLVGIFGASGKGKTTFLMLLKRLMNGDRQSGYAIEPDKNAIMNGNAHVNATLEGKTSVVIQELNKDDNDSGLMNFFKEYAGNASSDSMSINEKYQPMRTVKHRMAFTFDCEMMPRLNAVVRGHFRRTILINMPDDSPGDNPAFQKKYMDVINANLEGIFNYAQTLETEMLIDRITKLKHHPDIVKHVRAVRVENDSIFDFVTDFFEVSINSEDIISSRAVYEIFTSNNGMGKYAGRTTKKKLLIKMVLACLKDQMYGTGWTGKEINFDKPKYCKVTKFTERTFLTHLKLSEYASRTKWVENTDDFK